ncbi:MAG: helix-turn-helix transcriptional regulator [Desulfobulbus sp.]|nr:helix-turn-helix transcriptional regulator [Desulfobulbus sp.]
MSAKPKPPTELPAPGDLRGVLAFNLRLLRVQRGWSQEVLAFECGLDRTYVSAVERSRWNVSLSNIQTMADALQVPPWVLLKPPDAAPAASCHPPDLDRRA